MRYSFLSVAMITTMVAVSCNSTSTTPSQPMPQAQKSEAARPVITPKPKEIENATPPPRPSLPEKVIIDGTELISRSGKFLLSPQGMTTLQDAVNRARSSAIEFKVVVSGYSSSTGSRTRNIAISRRRAEFIANSLGKAGIQPEKLIVKAIGPDNPIAGNDTQAGRLKNQRVEIEFMRQ